MDEQRLDEQRQDEQRLAGRRLKRRIASFTARCAMASWVLLAAMPIGVVVYALA